MYIPYEENGKTEYRSLSRQLVMFCVERRKSWRMLQSKAGIVNREYHAQKAILADVEAGKISQGRFLRPRARNDGGEAGESGAGESVACP